ncbi:hypothetical protein [Planococcus sp. 107-1]|uniref:hypothetical protein n=1 Tax=Planococcus sp. 107-1 TaxID=2908840 RepID=UPI001F1DFAAB|nr:hypothetical protein [Planococcus sp. 107-1]UJF26284.1 hypothetical protein L0M13_14110 [Planococcus sp. 107-1]
MRISTWVIILCVFYSELSSIIQKIAIFIDLLHFQAAKIFVWMCPLGRTRVFLVERAHFSLNARKWI